LKKLIEAQAGRLNSNNGFETFPNLNAVSNIQITALTICAQPFLFSPIRIAALRAASGDAAIDFLATGQRSGDERLWPNSNLD
jgi:hypothetical protein